MTWLNWSLKFHIRLWTSSYLIHTYNTLICVIVHVQMWCVYTQPYVDQTKKIFDHFICIWKCFSSLFIFKFCTYFIFQCFKLVFVLKNRDQNLSRVVCDLATSSEAEKCIFGHLAVGFVSSSRVTRKLATREMPKSAILWVFREFLVQNSSYDSIMTPSFSNPFY